MDLEIFLDIFLLKGQSQQIHTCQSDTGYSSTTSTTSFGPTIPQFSLLASNTSVVFIRSLAAIIPHVSLPTCVWLLSATVPTATTTTNTTDHTTTNTPTILINNAVTTTASITKKNNDIKITTEKIENITVKQNVSLISATIVKACQGYSTITKNINAKNSDENNQNTSNKHVHRNATNDIFDNYNTQQKILNNKLCSEFLAQAVSIILKLIFTQIKMRNEFKFKNDKLKEVNLINKSDMTLSDILSDSILEIHMILSKKKNDNTSSNISMDNKTNINNNSSDNSISIAAAKLLTMLIEHLLTSSSPLGR